jgi:gluconolactonase
MPELAEVTSGLRFPEGPIAMPDGSKETMAEIPGGPNGAALGPNGLLHLLYWAETWRGRLLQRDIRAPGEVRVPASSTSTSAATASQGCNCSIRWPSTRRGTCASRRLVGCQWCQHGELDFVGTGDLITTNICFGDEDPTTGYITLSTTGRLVKSTWPRPGLAVQYLNA